MLERKEQESQTLAQCMAFVSEKKKSGLADEEVLARLYCRLLPDTSEQHGEWMARHVLEQTRKFDETQRMLLELDGRPEEERLFVLGEKILDMMDGFTLPSQCRKLRSLNQGMAVLEDLCRGTCTPEEAVRQWPAGYRGNTGEKGRNGELHIVLGNLYSSLGKTEAEKAAEKAANNLRLDGMEEILFRGVLTIALYSMMVNGVWASKQESLPVSIEYIAVTVCCLTSGGEIDATVLKLFLLAWFLSAGTATVTFMGSSIEIYSAFFLTARTAGELIRSSCF